VGPSPQRRRIFIEILHEVVVTFLTLFVQHVFGRILEARWQVFVEDLAGSK
jgi:hypothetical protein